MVRAWYMDASTENMKLEHIRQPPEFLDMDTVTKLTGVLYWKVSTNKLINDSNNPSVDNT